MSQHDNEPDLDAAWQSILDHYGERETIEEFLSEAERSPTEQPQTGAGAGPDRELDAESRDHVAHDRHEDDTEGHFVPPRPGPVPRPTTIRLLAWLGLFGVPLVVLVCLVVGLHLPGWLGLLCTGWFVGGFVTLVATMNNHRRDEWDDGAEI